MSEGVSTDRRNFLEALATIGIAGSAGCMNDDPSYLENDSYDSSSARLLNAYENELTDWQEPAEIDYDQNILIGERHMIRGDGLPALTNVVSEASPDVIGMEFIYEEDEMIDRFNQGDASIEEVITHLNDVTGYGRDPEDYRELLQEVKEKEAEIRGLEPEKGPFYDDSGTPINFSERSEGMADRAEELAHGFNSTVLFSGHAHVSNEMSVPASLLHSAVPELAQSLDASIIREDPYAWTSLQDTANDYSIFTEYTGKFTYKGRLNNTTEVLATSVEEQRWDLEQVIKEFGDKDEEVEEEIGEIDDLFSDLEHLQPHTGKTGGEYHVKLF